MSSLAFALLCFLTNTELVIADTQVDCTRNNNTTIIAAAASRKEENKHDLVESSSGITSSHQTTLESLPKALDDTHEKECASIAIGSNLSQNTPLSLSTFNPNTGIIMEPRNDDCTSESLDDPNISQNSVKKLENVQKKKELLPSKYPFLAAQDLPPPSTSRPLDSFTRYEVINSVQVEIKYCSACKIWRYPRSYHCYECQVCIDRHDHHCPWMGNCVGKYNYTFFYFFVGFTMANCFFVSINSILYLLQINQPLVVPIILSIFTGLIGWILVGLFGYHTNLISRNVTTHEDLRAVYPESRNPYDKGSIAANCVDILFEPYRNHRVERIAASI